MKKLISTILTLAIVIIAQSCREQDEILTTNNDINQEKLIFKRNSDSATIDSVTLSQNPIIGDPPPKNGHQW